ncbi:unnamed protein product [Amoebophrya sp. A120]|nr:unnamed protein product [Amoebophrya sp. A120]|eukprot:GSA120T00017600001.1
MPSYGVYSRGPPRSRIVPAAAPQYNDPSSDLISATSRPTSAKSPLATSQVEKRKVTREQYGAPTVPKISHRPRRPAWDDRPDATNNFFDPPFEDPDQIAEEIIYSDSDCTPHMRMKRRPNSAGNRRVFVGNHGTTATTSASSTTRTFATKRKCQFNYITKETTSVDVDEEKSQSINAEILGGDAVPQQQPLDSARRLLRHELDQADQMYESFVSRVRCFGVHHFSAAICLEDLGKHMNSVALAKLEDGQIPEARTILLVAERQMHAIGKQFYDYLKKAAVIPRAQLNTTESDKSRRRTFRQAFALFASLTLNNLASLERREGGDLQKALQYLSTSKMWVPELPAADAAVTYLNLSAVLSELGKHQEAESAAMGAVQRSEQDIMRLSKTTPSEYAEKVASLAVSYNNWAVQKELQFGSKEDCPPEAVHLYKKALHLATEHLDEGHPLREKFQQSVTAVLERNRRNRARSDVSDFYTLDRAKEELDWLQKHKPMVELEEDEIFDGDANIKPESDHDARHDPSSQNGRRRNRPAAFGDIPIAAISSLVSANDKIDIAVRKASSPPLAPSTTMQKNISPEESNISPNAEILGDDFCEDDDDDAVDKAEIDELQSAGDEPDFPVDTESATASWISRVKDALRETTQKEKSSPKRISVAVGKTKTTSGEQLLRLPLGAAPHMMQQNFFNAQKEMREVVETPLASPIPVERPITPVVAQEIVVQHSSNKQKHYVLQQQQNLFTSSSSSSSSPLTVLSSGTTTTLPPAIAPAGGSSLQQLQQHHSSPQTVLVEGKKWCGVAANQPVLVPRLAFAQKIKPFSHSAIDDETSASAGDDENSTEFSKSIPTMTSSVVQHQWSHSGVLSGAGPPPSAPTAPQHYQQYQPRLGGAGSAGGGPNAAATPASAVSTPLHLMSCRSTEKSTSCVILPSLQVPSLCTPLLNNARQHNTTALDIDAQSTISSARGGAGANRRRLPSSPMTLFQRGSPQLRKEKGVLSPAHGLVFPPPTTSSSRPQSASKPKTLFGNRPMKDMEVGPTAAAISAAGAPAPPPPTSASSLYTPQTLISQKIGSKSTTGTASSSSSSAAPSPTEPSVLGTSSRPSSTRNKHIRSQVEQSRAAERLQGWWRGRKRQAQVRRARHKTQMDKELAAQLRIQHAWKATVCGRKARRIFLKYQKGKRKRLEDLKLQRFVDWKFFVKKIAPREKNTAATTLQAGVRMHQERKKLVEAKKLQLQNAREEKLAELCKRRENRWKQEQKKTVLENLLIFTRQKKHAATFLSLFFAFRIRNVWPRRVRDRKVARIQSLVRGVFFRMRLATDFVHVKSVVREMGRSGQRVVVSAKRRFNRPDWRVEVTDYKEALACTTPTSSSKTTKSVAAATSTALRRAEATRAVFTGPLLVRAETIGTEPTGVVVLSETEFASVLLYQEKYKLQPAPLASKALQMFPVEKVLNACSLGTCSSSRPVMFLGLQAVTDALQPKPKKISPAEASAGAALEQSQAPDAPATIEEAAAGFSHRATAEIITPSAVENTSETPAPKVLPVAAKTPSPCTSPNIAGGLEQLSFAKSEISVSLPSDSKRGTVGGAEVEQADEPALQSISSGAPLQSSSRTLPLEAEQAPAGDKNCSSTPPCIITTPRSLSASQSGGELVLRPVQTASSSVRREDEKATPSESPGETIRPISARRSSPGKELQQKGSSAANAIAQNALGGFVSQPFSPPLQRASSSSSWRTPGNTPTPPIATTNRAEFPSSSSRSPIMPESGSSASSSRRKAAVPRMEYSPSGSSPLEIERSSRPGSRLDVQMVQGKEAAGAAGGTDDRPAASSEAERTDPPAPGAEDAATSRTSSVAPLPEINSSGRSAPSSRRGSPVIAASGSTNNRGNNTLYASTPRSPEPEDPASGSAQQHHEKDVQYDFPIPAGNDNSANDDAAPPNSEEKLQHQSSVPLFTRKAARPPPPAEHKLDLAWTDLMGEVLQYEAEEAQAKYEEKSQEFIANLPEEEQQELSSRAEPLPKTHLPEGAATMVATLEESDDPSAKTDFEASPLVVFPTKATAAEEQTEEEPEVPMPVPAATGAPPQDEQGLLYNEKLIFTAEEGGSCGLPSTDPEQAHHHQPRSRSNSGGAASTCEGTNKMSHLSLPWRCDECNFLNEVSPDQCVMCDALRPQPAAIEQSTRKPSHRSFRPTSAGTRPPSAPRTRVQLNAPPEPAPPNSIAKKKRAAAKGEVVVLTQQAVLSNTRPSSAARSRPISAASRRSTASRRSGVASEGGEKSQNAYMDPKPFSRTLR